MWPRVLNRPANCGPFPLRRARERATGPCERWPKPRAGGIHRPGPHPYRGPMPGGWSVSACISQARRVNHFPILTLAPSVPLHDQPRPAVSAEGPLPWSLGPRFVPRPVPRRPAPRRRVAVHQHVPRAVLTRGPRQGTVARHPRDSDQTRSPLVPVRAPLWVTPPVRTLHPHDTIRTRVRYAKTPAAISTGGDWCGPAGEHKSQTAPARQPGRRRRIRRRMTLWGSNIRSWW